MQLTPGTTPLESTSFYIEYRVDPSGELVATDTFPAPDLPPVPRITYTRAESRALISLYVPLTHRSSAQLGPSGDWLVTPGGGPYLLLRQTLAGDTLLIVSRDYAPVTTPAAIRDSLIAAAFPDGAVLQNDFSRDEVPTTYPPFERIIEATDRTLWLTRYVDEGLLELEIFSADGLYLGAADLPDGFDRVSIHEITADHMYGVLRDELDVNHLVRYGIRRGPG